MTPVVREMLLCNDWFANGNRVALIDLVSTIAARDFPLVRDFVVFVMLTEGYASGQLQIQSLYDETGELIFASPSLSIEFPVNPLAVVGLPIAIRDARFPHPGFYSIQLWYNDEMLTERSLLVTGVRP